jgi:hypothetical protein
LPIGALYHLLSLQYSTPPPTTSQNEAPAVQVLMVF